MTARRRAKTSAISSAELAASAPLFPCAPPARASAWATRQAWLAHFTVSDVDGKKFHSFEHWSRDAVGLAGAQGQPFKVWVKDWTAEGAPVFPFAWELALRENMREYARLTPAEQRRLRRELREDEAAGPLRGALAPLRGQLRAGRIDTPDDLGGAVGQ